MTMLFATDSGDSFGTLTHIFTCVPVSDCGAPPPPVTDSGGSLSALSTRCHPVTQLYVSRLLLHQPPPPDHDPLLLCLTEGEAAPAWLPDQHTLIKATLASVGAGRMV